MRILKDLIRMLSGFGPEEPDAISVLLFVTVLVLIIVFVVKLT